MNVKVHPVAVLFPLMSHTELSQLAEDTRWPGTLKTSCPDCYGR